MACSRAQMTQRLIELLKPGEFHDSCPNGLQVQGREKIKLLVSGVTASQLLIDAAVRVSADAVLVHHGFFWRSEEPCIVGMKAWRLKQLILADINLYAYHLPLDCHPTLGNNAQLGKLMGIAEPTPVNPQQPNLPLFRGDLPSQMSLKDFGKSLSVTLDRPPLIVGDRLVRTVFWCTGAGQSYIERACALGADVFVTGEVSEQTIHIAREYGIGFVAAGHHATERYGVQAVGEALADELGCEHLFIDIDNPV